ncbi:MAG: DNA polymerase I [Syntrophus sp. (in: bacteria)]|nr:DNA polymerase I [Syntrophus sp. (in: bacteria)]
MKKPTLFLIDGSNYIFRAFYAIRELSNSKGFPTNAIYGFTTMLMRLLREQKPDYIAVAFDVKGPTFRHDAFDQYKATRKATPETLIPQIPCIKNIVRGFSIPVLEQQGIEADDIIGTLARRYAGKNFKVFIVSGDKDMMQLVTDDIVMIDTMKDKIYDIAAVKARFGVEPDRVVEILGLMGDSSDNIPGVPGIGPKNALRLIEEYGTIEEIIKNVERLTNAKAKQSMRQYAEQARMSRELAIIRTDADFDFDFEACRYTGPNPDILKDLFQEFEFSSLIQELKIREETLAGHYAIITSADDLMAFVEKLRHIEAFVVEMIASADGPLRTDLIGLALCAGDGEAVYIPIGHAYYGAPPQLREAGVLAALAPALSDEKIQKHGHDLKSMILMLARRGCELKGLGCDTMVAAYLLNPSRHGYELAEIVREQLQRQIVSVKELVGAGAKALPLSMVKTETMMDYACRRADAVCKLTGDVSQKLQREGFDNLFNRIETPLVSVLAAMEKKGVLLDLTLLKDMSREIQQLLSLSENKIYQLAGEKFNVNSPKQLQTILFDKLCLPKGKKTKEGYSTGVDVLNDLAASHELPAEILAYRSFAKLKSTYIDALPLMVNPDTGRVHTSYNQTVTATGRLSSSSPNLQNIPIRTPEGRRIRQAFIAPEGWEIIAADYSQIELRVLAHLSQDRSLIDAFASGEDIHSRTASDIFGVFPAMVNTEMRRQAKVINFGVLYGMSAFGLAKELNVNQKLAQAYIDGYFDKYRDVRRYLDGILENARKNGYVQTLLNRRRYLPEINHSVAAVRQFAERTAINAPIQGTAADLIKAAMINISRLFAQRRLKASMIMQVHDELVFEAPQSETQEIMALVKAEMENVMPLSIPLRVDIGSGRNWDEAHG